MTEKSLLPHSENLRNAIHWLSELQFQHAPQPLSREDFESASIRFDLTPLEEEFLLRKFVSNQD